MRSCVPSRNARQRFLRWLGSRCDGLLRLQTRATKGFVISNVAPLCHVPCTPSRLEGAPHIFVLGDMNDTPHGKMGFLADLQVSAPGTVMLRLGAAALLHMNCVDCGC
jgi:hypothetical protein